MIKHLIKMASSLDSMGLKREADAVDSLIRKIGQNDSEENEFKPDEDVLALEKPSSKKAKRFLESIYIIKEYAENMANRDTLRFSSLINLSTSLLIRDITFITSTLMEMRHNFSSEDALKIKNIRDDIYDLGEDIYMFSRLVYSSKIFVTKDEFGESVVSKEKLSDNKGDELASNLDQILSDYKQKLEGLVELIVHLDKNYTL